MNNNKTVLSIRNLRKEYPGVVAINGLSCDFFEGEIHAIIGENGAGKSTLIKCIAGAIAPTSGSIILDGISYNTLDPRLAKKYGIEVIYQEFNLVPVISAAENVYLCEKTSDSLIVNTKERERMAAKIFEQMGVKIDPSQKVREMSPANQQVIEIAKAISRKVKILIMDEPTAPLTVSEVDMLFKIVKTLKSQGVTIIYISHRLEELFEIADRVTVMRDGNWIDTRDMIDVNRKELIRLMAGRTLNESFPSRKTRIGEEALRVENLSGNGVSNINFSLNKGEVLGFAGLIGAGRSELMHVIIGSVPKDQGKIFINQKEVDIKNPKNALEMGIGLIPEDRKRSGVFLNQTVKWNCSIAAIKKLSKSFIVNKKEEIKLAEYYRDKFMIKTPTLEQKVINLSGGNQQKVVLAKTMAANTNILIFDEPTRGIDVSTKQEIYKLMNELAESGHAIIMVSSEMPELLGMSDRLVVIAEGRQTGILERSQFDPNHILDLASSTFK